jgi:hypothetical protein
VLFVVLVIRGDMVKTIYVVFKVGRQVDGEYVMISVEKAFANSQQAEEYWKKQSVTVWREIIEGVECHCERAVHEVELED